MDSPAEALFHEALELDTGARALFLARVREEDPSRAKELAALLAAHDAAGGFMATPALLTEGGPDHLLGARAGAYRLLSLIGSGGMGSVYLAERADKAYEKRVAVKVIRRGMDTDEILRRFATERQLLAGLEHPYVARLLDAGALPDGRPFLVMEHVEGVPLDLYCRERRLPIGERLRLFRRVCEAVQTAHQSLIVHRDLKPGNVLVTKDGAPKLLDFGIAKVLGAPDDAARTLPDARLLTPRYASPEQVRGDMITTASDVYSLGVILYELLTDQSPYPDAKADPRPLEDLVCAHEPVKPSTAAAVARGPRGPGPPGVDEDLDTIVLHALEKDAARRYATVGALSDDIGRYLDGFPIHARAQSLGYRALKFVRRHRAPVAAAASGVILLIAATAISTSLLVRAKRAESEAGRQRAAAEDVSRFLEETLASIDPATARGRDVRVLKDVLDTASRRIDAGLDRQPEAAARLHLTIGRTYFAIGAYEEAEPHLRKAVALRRDTFGRRDARTAEAIDALGRLLEARGAYDEAEAMLGSAVEIRRSSPDDPALGTSLVHLGTFLFLNRQRTDEAVAALEEAVRILRAGRPVDLANALHSIAGVLRDGRKDYAAAEPLYREATALKREHLAPDHPSLALTLQHLASLHLFRGEHAAAEPLFREALAINRKVLGEDHRDYGTAVNNFAGLLMQTGRLDEAAEHFRTTVSVYTGALGADHAWTAIALGNLALVEARRRDFAAAAKAAVECRRVQKLFWPDDHWRAAGVEAVRGTCLAAEGRHEEAETVLVEAVRILEKERGPSDAWTKAARGFAAEMYDGWGRPEDARRYR